LVNSTPKINICILSALAMAVPTPGTKTGSIDRCLRSSICQDDSDLRGYGGLWTRYGLEWAQ
jgi:hypothetical protein